MTSTSAHDQSDGLPWQVKLMFVVIALVLLFVIGIDILEFASAL
jgi:type III secretory pathway component EscS